MSDHSAQLTLNKILGDLTSDDTARQISALNELERTSYSSAAILDRLEQLAVHAEGAVQKLATNALSLSTSQLVSSKLSTIPKDDRELLIREISLWEKDGLIEKLNAEVIRRRYDFDIRTGISIKEAVTATEPQKQEEEIEPAESIQLETPKPAIRPRVAETRPSLTQVLLSETSIRIYLFLGAFFVIAAAAILAALVEAARLPVLLIATFAFAAAAIGFKKRLPQPSFAFGIVFSFLLPIDGGVIADLLAFSGRSENMYWSVVYIGMTVIWAFGTRFYESRLFSLASFFAFTLAAVQFVLAFAGSNDWIATAMGFSALVGLLGVRTLNKWKDQKFAAPLFLSAQVLQGITLLVAITQVTANLFNTRLPADAWIAHTLILIFAAALFAVSDILVPFVLFPWLSAVSLFLVPWLFLSAFNASTIVIGTGFGIWSALIAIGSHIAYRAQSKQVNKYYFPLLALSLPLFSVTILLGLIESVLYAFAAFLLTTIIYTLIHVLHPRWYVWTAALIAGLGAYFAFFAFPFMERANIYIGFQLLLASILLLLPELFFKGSLTMTRSWNWPPVALGIVVAAFNVLVTHIYMIDGNYNVGNASIILGAYALLVAAYALRFNLPLIGFLATAFTALAIVYALIYFERDLWLPLLTALGIIYYFAGFGLARSEQTNRWGAMLIRSGLALGVIVSSAALLSLKISGGWYAIAIAALVFIEMFTRRNSYLEILALGLLNAALVIILKDFKVNEFTYTILGSSFLWLGGDAILHLIFQDRKARPITIAAGAIATFSFVQSAVLIGSLAASVTTICFAIYSAFFAAYALTFKSPRLGFLSTASAVVTVFYILDHFNSELWLPIFTSLALAYYIAGFLLKKSSAGWAQTLRFSGLGLGSLLSLVALFNYEPTGGWYAGLVGLLFVSEAVSTRNGWFEAGVYVPFSIASFLFLRELEIHEISYILLALSLVWLGGDAVFEKTFKARKIASSVQLVGGAIAALNALVLLSGANIEAAICYSTYTVFFAVYAWLHGKPFLSFASTISLPLAVLFSYKTAAWQGWQFALIGIAVLYYAVSLFLRKRAPVKGWELVFFLSGLSLGTITAFTSPLQPGGAENALPIAVAATLFAAEAFARRSVWLAFPANGLYLISYFTLLIKLNVDEPQYFSIGAALLGLLMHYLLVRANSKIGAFVMGMASQLVLLGTTYIQMISTSQLGFFLVLFVQSLVILVYGIIMRSRSLVIAPIGFAVIGTLTVLYSAMKGLSVVLIVGVTGITLLVLGVIAVLMRERITSLAERFGEWNA